MSEHRIETIRVHRVNIPAKAVHSYGSGDVAGINAVILEIVTDSGITGTAEGNAAVLHVHLRPHLIGEDPVQVEKHLNMAGKVIVPTAPGLGVRADPEKLEKFRTDLLT